MRNRLFANDKPIYLVECYYLELMMPLPRIDETVNRIPQYLVFSTIDLKSAYNQVPLQDKDKCFTAFEANRRLYQFRGIPFGVRNGAAAFQKITYNFRTNESLSDTFAYFDDITICVHDQAYHDKNLENLWLLQKTKKFDLQRRQM